MGWIYIYSYESAKVVGGFVNFFGTLLKSENRGRERGDTERDRERQTETKRERQRDRVTDRKRERDGEKHNAGKQRDGHGDWLICNAEPAAKVISEPHTIHQITRLLRHTRL